MRTLLLLALAVARASADVNNCVDADPLLCETFRNELNGISPASLVRTTAIERCSAKDASVALYCTATCVNATPSNCGA